MSQYFRPVIQSLLETDLYKFSMLQALLHKYPTNTAEYRFVCRNKPAFPLAELADEVNRQLDYLCTLRFSPDELKYLATRSYFKPDFIEYLRMFQLHRPFIEARAEGDQLSIIARGPQVHVMLFEIYVLAIVNELYFRRLEIEDLSEGRTRLRDKVVQLRDALTDLQLRHPFEFFDF